jgi:L-rhamnose mutarotase
MTQRICFRLQVRADRLDEYRARHAAVWPEMRDALRASGWRNYSLFLTDEGELIGYVECDDFGAIRRAMEATDVNGRWQAEMAPFFAGLGGGRADEGMRPIPEIFHLD